MRIEQIIGAAKDFPVSGLEQEPDLLDPRDDEFVRISEELPEEIEPLSEEEITIIDRLVEEGGFEVLAYYVPYHIDPHGWGIYLKGSGIRYIATHLMNSGVDSKTAKSAAVQILELHERFHYHTELATSIVEGLLQRPIYSEVFNRTGSIDKQNPIEEALANAYALDNLDGLGKQAKTVRNEIERLFKNSPAGYRDYYRYRNDWYEHGLRTFVAQWPINPQDLRITTPAELLFRQSEPSINKMCPVRTVTTSPSVPNANWYTIAGMVPPAVLERFVTKYCRGEANGGTKHPVYILDNHKRVALSNSHGGRKDVPPSRVKKVASCAGYTLNEWAKLLHTTKNFKKDCPRSIPLAPVCAGDCVQ